MTAIKMSHIYGNIFVFSLQNSDFKVALVQYDKLNLTLKNLLNLL